MDKSIHFKGLWAYAWGLWVVLFMAWALWAPILTTHDGLLLGFRILFSIFMPMELCGAYVMAKRESPEERVYTLSQLLQRVAQKSLPNVPWWKGWNALVTGYTVLISTTIGMAFWQITPVHGIVFGVTVFLWNIYHWLRRYKYG